MKSEYRILEDGTIHIYSSWRVKKKDVRKIYELGLNTYKGKGRANWKGGNFRDD